MAVFTNSTKSLRLPDKISHMGHEVCHFNRIHIGAKWKGRWIFRPNCGLRQGYTLSPYLFILGMNLLTRCLHYQLARRELVGVKIAATTTPVSCSLYADDLLIMGAANTCEVQHILNTLQVFTRVSGQKVGPEKISI